MEKPASRATVVSTYPAFAAAWLRGTLASVAHDGEPIEHDLIRTGTAVEFEVVETKVEPTVGDEDSHVRIYDQWSAADMLRGLEFARGRLHWHADYVRGRCIKTTVEVSPDGTVLVETVNRGEAATRWVDRLEGKKYLQAVE